MQTNKIIMNDNNYYYTNIKYNIKNVELLNL